MTRDFQHGLVVGKFYPLHAGHSALIRRAVSECDVVTVQLLASVTESIPLAVRESWLREEHPEVQVVAAYDEVPVDFDDPAIWDLHMEVITALLDRPVDAVYTSDAYGAELARRLDAPWVQVDRSRLDVPVSGSAVRADPETYWWALAPCVRSWFCRRVVVLGAESTGTTTLARQLADHYATAWVPEYGRTWSEIRPGGLDAPWESREFDHVAARQIELEDTAARATPRPLIISDTDALATTVWHERYVGTTSPSVVEVARSRRPDLYLLTDADVPFVQDGLRDGEHLRQHMTDRFREVLDAQHAPWVEISGSWDMRLARAVTAIDDLFGITAENVEERRSECGTSSRHRRSNAARGRLSPGWQGVHSK